MYERIGVVVAVEQRPLLKKYGSGERLQVGGFPVHRYRLAGLPENRFSDSGSMRTDVRNAESPVPRVPVRKDGSENGDAADAGGTPPHPAVPDVTVSVVCCGAGQLAAAAATQLLIDRFDVQVILNYGTAGALTASRSIGEICLIDALVHYEFDATDLGFAPGQYPGMDSVFFHTDRELLHLAERVLRSPQDRKSGGEICGFPDAKQVPGAGSRSQEICRKPAEQTRPEGDRAAGDGDTVSPVRVVCASGNRFVGKREKREELAKRTGADIAEMEAAAVLLTANRNGIPGLFLKGISDTPDLPPEDAANVFRSVTERCFAAADQVLRALASGSFCGQAAGKGIQQAGGE